jgi:hypothetical protein
MALFALLGSSLHPIAAAAPMALPPRAQAGSNADPWVQAAHQGVKAYSRAADAYTADLMSVALWALVIAAGVVLLEWLIWRYRSRR